MNGIGRGDDNQKKNKASVITRETVGMTLLLFGAVLFFIAVTGKYVFGEIGVAITAFFLGLSGFMAYPLLLLVVYLSVVLTFGKKWIPAKWLVRGGLVLLSVFLIVHTATSVPRFCGEGYGAYLSGCWNAAAERAADATGGGLLLGLIVYPLQALLSSAGAYVILSLLLILALFYFLMGTPLRAAVKGLFRKKEGKEKASGSADEHPSAIGFDDIAAPEARSVPSEAFRGERTAPARDPRMNAKSGDDEYERSRAILFHTDPATSYRNNLIFDHDSYFNSQKRRSNVEQQAEPQPAKQENYSESWSQSAENGRSSVPRRITENKPGEESGYVYPAADDLNYPQTPSYKIPSKPAEPPRDFYARDVYPAQEESAPAEETEQPAPLPEEPPKEQSPRDREADFRALFSRPSAEDPAPARRDFSDFRRETSTDPSAEDSAPARRGFGEFTRGTEDSSRAEDEFPVGDSRVFDAPLSERSHADLFDDDEPEPQEPVSEEPPRAARAFSERSFRREEASAPEEPAPAPKKHVYKEYVRPGNNLFRYYDDTVSVSQEEIDRNCSTIVETLAGFRVDAEVVKVTCGSAVTRYDIDIPRNIAVRSVIRHDQEIAMRLHARDGVNIYSNSEVGAISIEVPNSVRATVGIKSVLKADEYVNAKPTALMFAIGKDVEGRNVCGNIAKMKHILVAGSTGSGKSVCLNAMLISLICKYSPQDLRLILIDPKKVEFAVYDGLPHLMINEIIADAQKAVAALNWAIKEMERRYQLFEQKTRNGKLVHDVDEYNVNLSEGEEKLPKIVIVVDELADLMSVAKKDIEDRIQRLAQKARAAGIHLVIATQRPSVDVITGVIKGNLPTRIAFRVIQEVDSRTIIDSSGAEKLLGNGDMLYRTEGMFNCSRVQGAFLSSEEVQAVIEDIKSHNEAYFDDSVADYINRSEESAAGEGSDDGYEGSEEIDQQRIDALRIVVKLGSASISLIQRKCSVGYNHAGKIIEWMEMRGYISPFDGKAKARTVLLTKEEFEAKYGSLDG